MTRFFLEETFVSGALLLVMVLLLNQSRIDIGYTNSLMLAASGVLCILYVLGARVRRWRAMRSDRRAP